MPVNTLCNIIAKNIIISTSAREVVAAAPNAMPSAATQIIILYINVVKQGCNTASSYLTSKIFIL